MASNRAARGADPTRDRSRSVVRGWSVPGYLIRVTVLVLTGLTWSARAAQEVLFHPDYLNPRTTADFFAVYSFSAAWLLTAASLLVLRELAPPVPRLSAAIFVVASACALAGVANGFEDGLGAKWLGFAYVIGALVGALGMFGIVALLRTSPSPRLLVVPLAACVTMLMLTTVVGMLGAVPWLGLTIFTIHARSGLLEGGSVGDLPAGAAGSRDRAS